MPNTPTTVAYVIHVGAGMIGLVSGSVALIARKGGRLHRRAGTIFIGSMSAMAIFACYLAVVVPDQMVNVFIAILTLYLLSTAWMTVRRHPGTAGTFERFALLVAICICAPFAVLSIQLTLGWQPLFKSSVPFKGAVLAAIYTFTAVLAAAAIGDARVVFGGGISGVPRISRHLWRMCLGLTLATGSAFTNGFARLLPGPYHVPPGFFYPQFIPLAMMVFWLIRVRSKAWRQQQPTTTVPNPRR